MSGLESCPQLQARGLAAGIGGRTIVSDVTFTVPAGARLALVGANGAGKSTLLRTLAGIAAPISGSVDIGGTAISTLPSRERARKLAFVAQNETPQPDLLVGEMVALGRVPHRKPWSGGGEKEREIVVDALVAVGLDDRINSSCDELSGGELHRAVLARGFAQRVPILVLDEPTNHLDIAWQLKVLALVRRYPGTVIAAVHDLDLVLRHFDTVAAIDGGVITAFGDPTTVLSESLIAHSFGVCATQTPHPSTGEQHLLISSISKGR